MKEELAGKTPVQMKELKITIANLCRSQALAHRHTADAVDHLTTLDRNCQSAGSDDSNKLMSETSGCGENSRSRRDATKSAGQR